MGAQPQCKRSHGFQSRTAGPSAWCASCSRGLGGTFSWLSQSSSLFRGEEIAFQKVQKAFPESQNSALKIFAHTPMQHITLSTDKLSVHQAGLFKNSGDVVASANSLYQCQQSLYCQLKTTEFITELMNNTTLNEDFHLSDIQNLGVQQTPDNFNIIRLGNMFLKGKLL